jgi:HAD superfamily hydrolase (TIGR01509 family)
MPIYDTAVPDMLRDLGRVPRPGLYEALRPLSGMQVAAYLREEYGLDVTQEELRDAMDRRLEEFYFNVAPIKPGVLEFVDKLASRGVKMCVATATNRRLAEGALERVGLAPYFSRVFSCAEENMGKDDTEFFLRVLRHLGTPRERTAVFEDALHAAATAKRAGFPVVAVFDASAAVHEAELRDVADLYIASFAEAEL